LSKSKHTFNYTVTNVCFDLLKRIPYLYYTEHNVDDSPKDCLYIVILYFYWLLVIFLFILKLNFVVLRM